MRYIYVYDIIIVPTLQTVMTSGDVHVKQTSAHCEHSTNVIINHQM